MEESPRPMHERVLQRIPIISHTIITAFAIWGPIYCPLAFALFDLFVHTWLLLTNGRTMYGTWCAWQGVKKHAKEDWRAVYDAKRMSKGPLADCLEFDDVEHLIIIPNYEEDITVLRETLYLLSTHPLARKYHPVLGMEARERGARTKAETLLQEFSGAFASVAYTLHPGGIVGEAAGKSSNLSWAVRQAWFTVSERGAQAEARTVVTVLDSDTALAGDYFASITCKYALRNADERTRMSFVPPIVFDRNAHEVPAPVRLVDMFWAMAGLSTIYPTSSVKIPTSAYSMSLNLASRVGFWDAGPGAIGEDMHMFIKTLFCTGGNLVSETIYSPASQLDVCSEDNRGYRGYFNDSKARYKQALRHLWGSLDSGYTLTRLYRREFSPCERDFVSAAHQGAPVGLHTLNGMSSGASTLSAPSVWVDRIGATTPASDISSPFDSASEETTSVSSLDLSEDESKSPRHATFRSPSRHNTKVLPFMLLIARIYEAHLLIGHITILSAARISYYILSVLLPNRVVFNPLPPGPLSELIISWSRYLGWHLGYVFFAMSVVMLVFYGCYHQQAALYRWRNSSNLGAQPTARSFRPFPGATWDALAIPGCFFFGVIPAFHAQVMHLFTDRITYSVSFKPKAILPKALLAKTSSARDVEKCMA